MLVIQNTEHFRIESPTIVTIGTFDGVHLGHQKILARLRELKKQTGLKTVVFTFEPHPRKVLFPEQRDLKLLTSTQEKLNLLEQFGVDVAVVYPFTKEFAQLESESYIKDILVKQLQVKHLVIGYDHKFGKQRSGDITTLRQYARDFDYHVEEISVKDIDQIAISSSKIRKAIEEGVVETASTYLGHHFIIHAKVIKGKQLGRQLGYPTANLEPGLPEKLIPKIGVYLVEVVIDKEMLFGMMNIGTNPTTDVNKSLKLEVHIFNFNQDIYSKEIGVRFIKRLRDELKFNGLNELKAALDKDKEESNKLIAVLQ